MAQIVTNRNRRLDEDDGGILPLLFRRWKKVAAFTFIGAVIALAISFVLPREYESSATVFVHSDTLSKAAAAANLMGVSLSGSNSTEYVVSILESRPMKTLVMSHLSKSDIGYLQLDDFPLPVTVKEDKRKGSLILECRTYSPELSANIINLMIDNLGKLVVSNSKRKSGFIEKRLDEVQDQLDEQGRKIRRFEETHDIAMLTEDSKALIDRLSTVEAELMKLDTSIKAMDSELVSSVDPEALVALKVRRASEQSSRDYVAAQATKLRRQMATLPALAQQYAILQRQQAVLAKTFEILSERYQTSAISQVGEDGDYEIIERAVPIHKPVSPKKLWTTIMGMVLGFLLSSILIYIRECDRVPVRGLEL